MQRVSFNRFGQDYWLHAICPHPARFQDNFCLKVFGPARPDCRQLRQGVGRPVQAFDLSPKALNYVKPGLAPIVQKCATCFQKMHLPGLARWQAFCVESGKMYKAGAVPVRLGRFSLGSFLGFALWLATQLSGFAATSVTLAWNASTDPTVVGYNLYYGGASLTYTNEISAGASTNVTVSGLVPGTTYYFAATTYNAANMESPLSVEVSYLVPQDVSGNQAPTLNPIGNLAINENAGLQTVNLSGITSGATNQIQTLTVSAFSSNTNLIPNPTVNYVSANPTGSLTFTPVVNANGTATLTVTVNNGGASNNIVTQTFTVRVNPVNQPPTLNAIGNLALSENAGLQTVNLSGITSGATNENQTLTVTATSSNTGLIPNPTVHYTSANTTGSLTFTPVTYASGTATVTVKVNDGGTSNNIVTRTFTVTVVPVNQAPTLNAIGNLNLNENAGLQTVILSGITSGAPNENQTLTVTATSGNTGLIPNPMVNYVSPNTNGSLTFTPVANGNGTAIITVKVNDGGASNNIVTRTFTVTVAPVNQPPTLNPIGNLSINKNAGLQTVTLSGITSGATNENQTLTVTASSGNTSLIPNPTVNYTSPNTTGTLSFQPVTNASGSAVITVTVNDGGTSNNLVVQTFTVNVLAITDLTPPTDQITAPVVNFQTTNAAYLVKGTARDNIGVKEVYCSLNGSSWTPATTTNNWTNWTANVTLAPGPNTIRACAMDTSGNMSSTNSVLCHFVVYAPLRVKVNGAGLVKPNYNGDQLKVGEPYAMTAQSPAGFTFTNWTDGHGTLMTNKPALSFIMASNLTLMANFKDDGKPTVSIVTPKANQQWTNGGFNVTGKAGDNMAVAGVYYSLNGSGWTAVSTANNWTNWTANVTLTPGTNTIQAYAVDSTGNFSATNTVKFEYVVRKPLTVQVTGSGSVSPNYNNVLLAINENYRMTAKASPGFGITNWTDGHGTVITNGATLQFTMRSNLTFTANFVDVTRPTLSITAPRMNAQVTAGGFTVTGKSGDNVAVRAVYYSLNGSAWATATTANGWMTWTANVTLIPGTNTVKAYAVDTSGNFSTTNTVKFVYDSSPSSINGLMGAVNENGGGRFYLCFGSGTFSQNSGDTNYENGVGNYSYQKLTANTAKVSLTYTAPPDLAGSSNIVLLTFTTNNLCAFTNQDDAANTGTIGFWAVPNWAAVSLNGRNSALIADGAQATAAFGANTVVITNGAGQTQSGTYTFKQYSPVGALVTEMLPQETNYLELTFSATNYGIFADTAYISSSNAPVADAGVFALLSQAAGGNAPDSMAGLAGQVTQPDGVFEMGFAAATFSQDSLDTNYANGVGTYTYTRLSTNTAQLDVAYTAPPHFHQCCWACDPDIYRSEFLRVEQPGRQQRQHPRRHEPLDAANQLGANLVEPDEPLLQPRSVGWSMW